MPLVLLKNEFSIIDPIKLNDKLFNGSNYGEIIYSNKKKDGSLDKAGRDTVKQVIQLKNYDSPYKYTNEWNKTSITIDIINRKNLINMIKKYRYTFGSFIYLTISEPLDELYQARWYLQEKYFYSFKTDTFYLDDNTECKITSVEKDDDFIKIHYIEICKSTYDKDLKNKYKYDPITTTSIIDNKTYILKKVNCDYSDDKIRTTHKYNKKREFKFNQEVDGSTDTIAAGTKLKVKEIYPPQLEWSNLVDRQFDLKDTNGNSHTVTVKDTDDDNDKLSFKEDIDYKVVDNFLVVSNDDSSQSDNDDEDIDTDKNKGTIDIKFNYDKNIYCEYYDIYKNIYCFLSNGKDLYNVIPIDTYKINNIKNNGVLDKDYAAMFRDIYTTVSNNTKAYLEFKEYKGVYSLLAVDPYIEDKIIDKYLFTLLDKYFKNNSSTTEFTLKNNDNYIKFKFNLTYDAYIKKLDKDPGVYKEVDDDNNISIYTYYSNHTIEKYILKDIEITYYLSGKKFDYKAKDNKNYIIIPYMYSISKYMNNNNYLSLLKYTPKFITIIEKDTLIYFNFSVNFSLIKRVLKKMVKD